MNSGMHVETLVYLLRIRQDMRRGRLLMYLGEKRVERLACFIDGYRACLLANGSGDDEYERFTGWLLAVKKQASGKEWLAKYLRNCQGDHEQAIREYLDLAAEFSAMEGGSAAVQDGGDGSLEKKAGHVGTFDVLLRIRQDMMQGKVFMHISEASAECFETFVEGCHACLIANGLADEEYERFFEWLRDVKQEMPGEGWPAKYLRDCQGDHEQAIRKYLGLAAEFANLRAQGG